MNPYGVPTYHPDPIALARWTEANARARRDYYQRTDDAIDYAALAARAARRVKARARKKATT